VDEDGSGEVFAPQEMKFTRMASMRSREAADHVSGLMRHIRSHGFLLRFFSRAHRSKFHLLERDTTVPALKEMAAFLSISRVQYALV